MSDPPITADELDAMTAEEAWDRCCYLAWLHQRDHRRHRAMQNAIDEQREQVAALMTQHKCDDPKCEICEWNRSVTRGA